MASESKLGSHNPEQRRKTTERVEREKAEAEAKIRAIAERLLARLKASGQIGQNITVDDLLNGRDAEF